MSAKSLPRAPLSLALCLGALLLSTAFGRAAAPELLPAGVTACKLDALGQ